MPAGKWSSDSNKQANICSDGLCLMHFHCQSLSQASTLLHPSEQQRGSRIQSPGPNGKKGEKKLDLVTGPPCTLKQESAELIISRDGLQLFCTLDRWSRVLIKSRFRSINQMNFHTGAFKPCCLSWSSCSYLLTWVAWKWMEMQS